VYCSGVQLVQLVECKEANGRISQLRFILHLGQLDFHLGQLDGLVCLKALS